MIAAGRREDDTRVSITVSDLPKLLRLLDLEEAGPDLFVGHHPAEVGARTFGGQLLAQSVIAAGRTVEATPVHALSAHFIRGGDPKRPIEYRVLRLREGRAFSNRQVTATQDGEVLYVALVAFQDPKAGLEHAVTVPEVPFPEELPPLDEHFAGYEEHIAAFVNAMRPIDMRYVNDPAWKLREAGESLDHNRVWMRADGELPDDPLLHVAAMCYASDTTVLDSILTTHGLSWGFDRIFAATVNHSMWFHQESRFDEWLLYETKSPVATGSRGLATGRFFTREGALATTVVQEGLIRHFPARA